MMHSTTASSLNLNFEQYHASKNSTHNLLDLYDIQKRELYNGSVRFITNV